MYANTYNSLFPIKQMQYDLRVYKSGCVNAIKNQGRVNLRILKDIRINLRPFEILLQF